MRRKGNKNPRPWSGIVMFFRDLAGARTQDPHIKSVMLYLLSYQVDLFCGCKSTAFFVTEAFVGKIFSSVQLAFALSDDNYFISSAIHNGALLVVARATIDDDVHQVLVAVVDFLWVGEVFTDFVLFVKE